MSIHDEPFDPSSPALIVTVGNTVRKHRALNRDVTILGRAHGCDIGLSAPDVSSVHCLVYRGPGGFRIRDCQSRSGTHVNGQAIQEQALRDGDTIQVGPFSFQAHLPMDVAVALPAPALDSPTPSGSTPEAESARFRRLERVRQRLVRRAVLLRQKLREARDAQSGLRDRQSELERLAESVRAKAHECERKARQLDEAERELARARAALGRGHERDPGKPEPTLWALI